MAATYLTLIADELINRGPGLIEWPRCLHPNSATLSERHPGTWLVEITDDDAPEELNGKHVELTLKRIDWEPPVVASRDVVRF